MNQCFDVIVIGAGPGGYVAAIRAAQLGKSVACIDEGTHAAGSPAPGGTCTNVGCIPSKALLQSSEHYEHALHHFREHGITATGVSIDVAAMIARKDKVVRQNNDGILYLFKKNKVRFFHGRGSFAGSTEQGYLVHVDPLGKEVGHDIVGEHVIVATGSHPRELSGAPFDETAVLSNTGALALRSVPRRLGVIGAGVIGLELGSVWRRLGAEVVLLEGLPTFLAAADAQIAAEARKAFQRQGLRIELGVTVRSVEREGEGVRVVYADAQGVEQSVEFDKLIVSVGRVPHTASLGADTVGLEVDGRGAVVVDEECRTNLPKVWAIGDVVRGPMLAHKAEEEAVAVAERIAGQHGHVRFDTIPWVIYTSPEIAWVGRTEQQLQSDGVQYRSGAFPFLANGRARALGDTTGFVKVLADADSDEVLGVHLIGPMASELVAECVMAMEFHASSEDIARICHAHPSLSEAVKEAALAVDQRSLNS
ncbi:dihydrolipoyl dehydrogenase [Candidatus Symbiobacter mobilis]|uniref:Dihydrolipoyl dehydrogenase n=1 Tax=Candidatus Symbiobacter mobilis CR TaxID=946483 RepID=U5N513_9BURK|nr:dihydrolipoyl dehydrogenase [Candidatus Symbiobacter mobilis]AGX86427.1 dihydrolipoamide dehydrogenase [Candidatus Symbiobacter mobilis CR]